MAVYMVPNCLQKVSFVYMFNFPPPVDQILKIRGIHSFVLSNIYQAPIV